MTTLNIFMRIDNEHLYYFERYLAFDRITFFFASLLLNVILTAHVMALNILSIKKYRYINSFI